MKETLSLAEVLVQKMKTEGMPLAEELFKVGVKHLLSVQDQSKRKTKLLLVGGLPTKNFPSPNDEHAEQ